MSRFRMWRLRRRYRRNLRAVANDAQLAWSADLQAAVDKFAASLNKLTLEDWQRAGLRERKWR